MRKTPHLPPRTERESRPISALRAGALAMALLAPPAFGQETPAPTADNNLSPMAEAVPERLSDDVFDKRLIGAERSFRESAKDVPDFARFEAFARAAYKVGDGLQRAKTLGVVRALMVDASVPEARQQDLFVLNADLSAAQAARAQAAAEGRRLAGEVSAAPAQPQRIDHYVHEGLPENPAAVVVRISAVTEETRVSGRSPIKIERGDKWWEISKVKTRNPEIGTKTEKVMFPPQGFVVGLGKSAELEVFGGPEDARFPGRSRTVSVSYEAGIVTVAGEPFALTDLQSSFGRITSWDGRTTIYVSVGGVPAGRGR